MNEPAPQEPVKLAVVSNSLPPYRVHVHTRLVREIPEVRLFTVLTHEDDGRWALSAPPELNVVSFGKGESCWAQADPRQTPHEWRKGGRIIRWLARERVGAVVVHGYNDAGRLRILRWCHRHRVPVFVSGDSNSRADAAAGVKAFVKRRLLGRVRAWSTGVLPFGTRGREYFERYGFDPGRMFFFPLEPDHDLITSLDAETVARVAAGYGLDPARRRLLYSGRVVAHKRVDLLIDAFAAVADARPDWDAVVLGDGDERAAVEARVPAALAPRVKFLGHAADPRTVGAVCRACDVLVLPSEFEPWALVVNDATAAGMAVVSSDVPGAAADLVVDGVNGRIFPSGDAGALRDCLLDVTDPAKTDAMKAASPRVLASWRTERGGDPVAGLRKALRFAGVLP